MCPDPKYVVYSDLKDFVQSYLTALCRLHGQELLAKSINIMDCCLPLTALLLKSQLQTNLPNSAQVRSLMLYRSLVEDHDFLHNV